MNKTKSNKGSITTVVLVTCLFFVTILATAYTILSVIRQSQIKSELAVKQMYQNQVASSSEILENLIGVE